MRVVVALGGNALLKRGEPMTAENQRVNVRSAAPALAAVAKEHQLVLSTATAHRSVCWRCRRRRTPRSTRTRSTSSGRRRRG